MRRSTMSACHIHRPTLRWTLPLGRWVLVAAAILAVDAPIRAEQALWKGKPMSYAQERDFLAQHTRVIELTSHRGAHVAVCPDWQGRVMTSTCGGPQGPSFGFINHDFIRAGKLDPQFNNYGAEERMWLSPEGGQFSLWFKPGEPQDLNHWRTPPALNDGAFEVVALPSARECRLARRMQFQNASATSFDLDVARDVRLLGEGDLAALFGASAAKAMIADGVQLVAYETANTITNRGPAMSKPRGLVSIWMLGMLNAGPETVVIVPYRPVGEASSAAVVKSDYFGPIPPDRLKITSQAILFRADGNYRSKIGTSQQRARNVLGSIDFAGKVLTLVHFTMPDDPGACDYMNNMWQVPQAEPYVGDVANAYNDGPPAPGKKGLGAFYEIESLSPAAALKTGQSLEHRHRTVHVQAGLPTLAGLAKDVLGVDLDAVRQEMLGR